MQVFAHHYRLANGINARLVHIYHDSIHYTLIVEMFFCKTFKEIGSTPFPFYCNYTVPSDGTTVGSYCMVLVWLLFKEKRKQSFTGGESFGICSTYNKMGSPLKVLLYAFHLCVYSSALKSYAQTGVVTIRIKQKEISK